MAHWRKLFDEKYLGSWDFDDKPEVTVTIAEVKIEELADAKGGKSNKPVVYLKGTKKGWVLNKTNAKILAAQFGNDVAQWPGRKVTLCKRQCEAFGSIVDCIRVKEG